MGSLWTECSEAVRMRRYTLMLAGVWVVVVGASLGFDVYWLRETTREMAFQSALAHFNKDQAVRLWATSHGGVYVPVDEKTCPNPLLGHLPERDIVLPSGKQLTLMNPAYMLRQMQEEFAELYQICGRITSLRPLRPENRPDSWERKALEAIEAGAREIIEYAVLEEKPFLRLMRPMVTQEGCLKCHGVQGYKVGDIRGGVGIALPMTPYLDRESYQTVRLFVTHGIILTLGLAGIFLGYTRLQKGTAAREVAQRELKRYNALLETKNRQLQDFTSMASHDLQEPLRKIQIFGDLLKQQCESRLEEDERNFLQRILKASVHMREMISALLNYSRVTYNKKTTAVDLNKIVQEAISMLWAKIEEKGAIVKVGPLPVVQSHPYQMLQLFQNLIGNGIKFSDHKPVIHVKAEEKKGWVVISVADNGIGIPENYLERIFVAFERLHERSEYEGTGIGLAICKTVVENHGGHIRVQSEPGKGSTFFVALPVKTNDGPGCAYADSIT